MAVMFVDLDDFKTVNDSLGHAVGDELLQAVAGRLQAALRPEDTAARLGGDEFAVLIEALADEAEALEVAARIRGALEPPLEIGERILTVTASIGVAWLDGAGTDQDLLRDADVAMYAAKARGKAQIATFEPAMHARVLERLELNADLETALDNGELALVYQPLVELDGGAMIGVEALLRWNHPVRGLIMPDCFIALAESSGLIVPIGRWVLRSACEQLRSWQAAQPAAADLQVFVNVSALQLADPGFPDDVRAAIEVSGVCADRVTLEITEHLQADDSERMLSRLSELKRIGVRLAIDDFGTGYSSLSYLRSFPIDLLKIDRSFIVDIAQDAEATRLVRGIVEMGHALRLEIVTEGIEAAEQATLLRELGSDYAQGYHFSLPVDAAAIDRLLAGGMPAPPLPATADH
jgi:diguanylate cyclase (GGDEF)-like protein